MKILIPIILLLLVTINLTVKADAYTGKDILEISKTHDLVAAAYILGVFDVMILNKKICPNHNKVSREDIYQTAIRHLNKFEHENHYSAVGNISLAFRTKFPCN